MGGSRCVSLPRWLFGDQTGGVLQGDLPPDGAVAQGLSQHPVSWPIQLGTLVPEWGHCALSPLAGGLAKPLCLPRRRPSRGSPVPAWLVGAGCWEERQGQEKTPKGTRADGQRS